MSSIRERPLLLAGIAIVTMGALAFYAFSPWIRPEVTESGFVIKVNEENSCEVQSDSKMILVIWDCKGYTLKDNVTVKYRMGTSLGEIISNKP